MNGMEYWNGMALSVDFAIIVAVIRPVNRRCEMAGFLQVMRFKCMCQLPNVVKH